MLCSCCHGRHFVIQGGQVAPCPECGGMGEIHCCDGLTAQPENPRVLSGEEKPVSCRAEARVEA